MLNHLHLWGLDAQNYSLEYREAFARLDTQHLTQCLLSSPLITEVLILSTCNRFEIYLVSPYTAGVAAEIEALLSPFHQLLRYQQGRTVAQHVLEVSAGLKSQVLGEHYIAHQLKQALAEAKNLSSAGPLLNSLFQKAQHSAKGVRSYWQSQGGLPSYEQSIWAMLNVPRRSRVLILGLGQLGQGLADYLSRQPVQITVCNRDSSRAQQVAQYSHLSWRPWSERYQAALVADIVLVAVSSKASVLTQEQTETLLQSPRQLFDLSMPRALPTISTDLGYHPDARLLTLEDIGRKGHPQDMHLLKQAQLMIQSELRAFEFKIEHRTAFRSHYLAS